MRRGAVASLAAANAANARSREGCDRPEWADASGMRRDGASVVKQLLYSEGRREALRGMVSQI